MSATEILDIEADAPEDGDVWRLVRSPKKRRIYGGHGSGIMKIRKNLKLNQTAFDTYCGFTTQALLSCNELCGVQVRAYELIADRAVFSAT